MASAGGIAYHAAPLPLRESPRGRQRERGAGAICAGGSGARAATPPATPARVHPLTTMQMTCHRSTRARGCALSIVLLLAAPLAPAQTAPASSGTTDEPSSAVTLEKFEISDTKVDGLINKGLLQTGDEAPLYHDVISRVEIDQMGISNVEELFRMIPQTTSANTALQNDVGNFGIGARISTTSLRGFASSQTVILINGRPLPRTTNATGGGADLDRIPVAAIERIEVLPMAGSAIYGAGAIGGAINIILRKDYSGHDLTTYFGTTTDGGAGEYRFTYVEGRNFRNGKTNLTLTLNYQHRDGLRAGQRGFLDELWNRFGPNTTAKNAAGVSAWELFGISAFATGRPTLYVTSTTPTGDLGIPGAAGLRWAVVPAGTAPSATAALTPASFTAGANQFTRGNLAARTLIYEPIDSLSLNAQIEHVFIKDRLESYGEFTVTRGSKNFTYPTNPATVSLAATSALNPFRTNVTPGFVGRPVTVAIDPVDIPDSESRGRSDSARAVIGLKGRFSAKWSWSLDGAADYAHNMTAANTRLNYIATTFINPISYSLLSDHTQYPVDPSNIDKYFVYIRANGSHSTQFEGNARVTGDLFSLPAGPFRTSLTGKYRDLDLTSGFVQYGPDALRTVVSSASTASNPSASPVDSTRKSWQEAFELAAPVVSKRWHPIPVDAIDLNFSGSYEKNTSGGLNQSTQKTFGGSKKASSTYVTALKVQLTPDVALRGSYTSGFYPPDWADISDQITPQLFTPPATVVDPKRGNTPFTQAFTLYNGGNPNLKPEHASSHAFGVLLTPRFIKGLSLKVDYWKTVKDDAILRYSYATAVARPDDFAAYIIRAAPTPAEQALGWAGVVTEIHSGPINITQLKTDGVDLRVKYNWSMGRIGEFVFNSNASFTNHFITQQTPSQVPIETASAGGPIRWRGYGMLTWMKGRQSVTLAGKYVGHYSTATTSPTPAFPTAIAWDGGRIPAFLHWDLSYTYEFPIKMEKGWRSLVAGTTWKLGAINVLNEKPSFVTNGTSYYNMQDDPRGRFVYMQIKKSF
jgi:iron complex outermembrane recepter protein